MVVNSYCDWHSSIGYFIYSLFLNTKFLIKNWHSNQSIQGLQQKTVVKSFLISDLSALKASISIDILIP